MDEYQKVVRGRDSLNRLPGLMDKLGIVKPLVVGMKPLTDILSDRVPALSAMPVFSSFQSNPDLHDALAGAELYHAEACDGLISIGGGSSIDTAKTIKASLFAGSEEELIRNRFSVSGKCCHIAVPGTAGTGSEATQFAVVYLNGNKISLDHPGLRPEGAVLDPALLSTLPVYHKKSCAMDALAQGIESWWSRRSNDDSRVHAFLAITGVLDNLKAYLQGDPHAEEEMLDASFQSGKAIQITRTTAAHAMSYMLTKEMGIAHGHACMLTLPVLWDMTAEHIEVQDKMKNLSSVMRLGDVRMGPRLLKGILYDLKLAVPELPDEKMLEKLADSVNAERLNNHPVLLSKTDIREAYRKAMTPICENEKQACLDIWRYYGRG